MLINAPHGITAADEHVLQYLQAKCADREAKSPLSLQAILTKVDRMPMARGRERVLAITERLHEVAPACLAPILTSSKSPHIGIEQLRAAIVQTVNYR